MKNLVHLLPLLFAACMSVSAFAEEEAAAESVSDGRNEIGARILVGTLGQTPAIGMFYQRGLSGRWAFGGMLWGGRSKRVYVKSDYSSSSPSYYSDYGHGMNIMSYGIEAHLAFYFREDGLRRWSPLIRTALGYALREGHAYWYRDDLVDDFFNFLPNNYSEDGRGATHNWSTPYARIGAHYQFVLGANAQKGGHGHVIEAGPSVFLPFRPAKGEFTTPSGENITVREAWCEPAMEISYRFIF